MKPADYLKKTLKELCYRRPRWALSLYYKFPTSIKTAIRGKLQGTKSELVQFNKINFFPLDSASAEIIIAPFHDPMIAPTLPVTFTPIHAQGCSIEYRWCWTTLSWKKGSEKNEAAMFNFAMDIEVIKHDNLILCLSMSQEVTAVLKSE